MKFRFLLLLLAPVLLGVLAFAAADRRLAGPPGESVSIERNGFGLAASTDEGGTEEVVASPGENVTCTWMSGGATVTVTIVPQPGETDDGVTIRLARRVNALRKSFPIDPAPGG